MKTRCLFLVFIILSMAVYAAAQGKSLTNANLEQYKQERLKAQQEYLENYERLGQPSPQEIDQRVAASVKSLADLSTKLRAEQLELERIKAERIAVSRQLESYSQPVIVGVLNNMIYSSFRRHRHQNWPSFGSRYAQSGYFAGGQFWPTGPRTASQPMFGPTRH